MPSEQSAFALVHRYRRLFIIVVHLVLIVASSWLALWLRFDGSIPEFEWQLWLATLTWLVLIRAVSFIPLRLYEGLWRYTDLWDLRNIVIGVCGSSVAFYLLVHPGLGLTRYPRAVFIIDTVLLILFMSGIRLTRRLYREVAAPRGDKTLLIFGAGDAGELIVRDMRGDRSSTYEPIGFIDDNRLKVGRHIHGVPVLGTRADLAAIIKARRPDEFLIAIPSADPQTIRGVVRALEPFKLPIKTLPNLRDVLDGTIAIQHIRDLSIEDLLTRAPVDLDHSPLRAFIEGRRILIAGAGGSIGSELARQIADAAPTSLILFERHEHSLYTVASELADRGLGAIIAPLIGDVTDIDRVDAVLREHRPEIIFHAAAHKHVPMMEHNPCEAVKNNVRGTRILAEAAERHGVERFIFISSDKAVNPMSIMGATKRVAELVIQSLASNSRTSFYTVRFGNVLASNGSVVPRFLQQIKAGGPVTVTHPEMRRFFMLIPEAVHLVLHAAAQGRPGEVYVLQMGEQLRLLDLARNLIRLSGFVPDEDIQIIFTGPRPGEKLSEQLVGEDEAVIASTNPTIMRVQSRGRLDPTELALRVNALEEMAAHGHREGAIAMLCAIVPTFQRGDLDALPPAAAVM